MTTNQNENIDLVQKMHGVKGRLVALGGSYGKSVMGFPRFVGAKSLPGYSLKKPSKLGLRNVDFLFRPADVAKTCRKNAIMFRTCEVTFSVSSTPSFD